MKIKTKIKRKHYIIITILLIFFLSLFFYFFYTNKTSESIRCVTQSYLKKEIYSSLTKIVSDVMANQNVEDLLFIYRNSDDEILYVDYNLNKSYSILSGITNQVNAALDESYLLQLPFLISSSNVFLNNFGPKITVKINYVNSLLTNIYTKVTNYGLNNALLEIYLKVTIEGKVITPIEENTEKIEYDLLISSKVINGRVPSFYGGSLTKDSSLFNVPIE